MNVLIALAVTAGLLLSPLTEVPLPPDDGAATSEEAAGSDDIAVLVFTRTTGFRHASIPQGILAVHRLGMEHGFEVEHTEDPDDFTDENLARFAAVIWLNTTGDVLEDDGRAAFERYVRDGGGYVGVHSAADTEYDWPFYGELLGGAWFHSHPIQQSAEFDVEDTDHPSTAHLPERWDIPFEEYYSFVENPRPHVRVLLTIDEDTYDPDPNTTHLPDEPEPEWPEGESGEMGEDHPMAWCRDIDDGHAWYTALGHENWIYEDPDYQQHLLGGILTAAGVLEADCDPEATDGEPADARDEDVPATGPDDDPLPETGPALPPTTALLLVALSLVLLTTRFRVAAPRSRGDRRSRTAGGAP